MTAWPLDATTLMSTSDMLQSPEGDSIIVAPDAIHRLWRDGYAKGVMAVVIPFDLLFADRAAAAIRFWNSVMDNRAGPEPKPLTPYARGQLILAIRLLRSEERTSELQSLMRISYAVFCLKKKKNIQ